MKVIGIIKGEHIRTVDVLNTLVKFRVYRIEPVKRRVRKLISYIMIHQIVWCILVVLFVYVAQYTVFSYLLTFSTLVIVAKLLNIQRFVVVIDNKKYAT